MAHRPSKRDSIAYWYDVVTVEDTRNRLSNLSRSVDCEEEKRHKWE